MKLEVSHLEAKSLATLACRQEFWRESVPPIFRPDGLVADLISVGFHDVEMLASEQINVRYFKDRADGLKLTGGMGRLAAA